MRARLTIVGAAAAGTLALAAPQGTLLDRAGWLAGCWELRAPNRVTLEMWMPPAGDAMLGASRTVIGATVRESEQLRLRVEGGKLVYVAIPSAQRETAFPSTEISDTALVFENLAHDFPQRIIYRRRGADSILARIEGPGPNGVRGIDFPMRRASCISAAPPPPPDTATVDAAPSPDGKRIAFGSSRTGRTEVYVMNADGSNVQNVSRKPGARPRARLERRRRLPGLPLDARPRHERCLPHEAGRIRCGAHHAHTLGDAAGYRISMCVIRPSSTS